MTREESLELERATKAFLTRPGSDTRAVLLSVARTIPDFAIELPGIEAFADQYARLHAAMRRGMN